MTQLGVLPLIPLAVAGAGAVAAAFGLYQAKQVSDYEAWKKTIPAPAPAPAPSAPRTADQMRTWSTEQQLQSDQANYEAWKKTAMDQYQMAAQDDSLLILAAGVAVFALYLTFRR